MQGHLPPVEAAEWAAVEAVSVVVAAATTTDNPSVCDPTTLQLTLSSSGAAVPPAAEEAEEAVAWNPPSLGRRQGHESRQTRMHPSM